MKNKFTNQNSVLVRFSFVREPYRIQSRLFPKPLSAICLPLSFDAMLYIHNTECTGHHLLRGSSSRLADFLLVCIQ